MLNTHEFQNQTVRDLIWLLTSPALCHCTVEQWQIPNLHRDTLVQLEQDSGLLEHFVGVDKPQRLGHYVEKLWQFYLCHHSDLQILSHNQIVYDKKRTVGEFDLLLLDHRDQQIWHLELAIKYYLGLEQAWGAPECWTHWLGPGCRDSLDHKWHKLRYQQLILSQRPESQALLTQLRQQYDLDDTIPLNSASLTRGVLFYPLANNQNLSLPAPSQTEAAHARGHWCTVSHWLEHADNSSGWLILKKPHWLALPYAPKWQDKRSMTSIIQQELTRGPVYIVEVSDKKQAEVISESKAAETCTWSDRAACDWSNEYQAEHIKRYFIVPDQWPHYMPLPWHQLHPGMPRLDVAGLD